MTKNLKDFDLGDSKVKEFRFTELEMLVDDVIVNKLALFTEIMRRMQREGKIESFEIFYENWTNETVLRVIKK